MLGCTRGWLRYRLPKPLSARARIPCVSARKQKWFLLRMLADDAEVRFDRNDKPEFDHWQWVSYWYPLNQVIAFKREVYRRAMKELALPLGRHTVKAAGNLGVPRPCAKLSREVKCRRGDCRKPWISSSIGCTMPWAPRSAAYICGTRQ